MRMYFQCAGEEKGKRRRKSQSTRMASPVTTSSKGSEIHYLNITRRMISSVW